jgi:hypothetical protein
MRVGELVEVQGKLTLLLLRVGETCLSWTAGARCLSNRFDVRACLGVPVALRMAQAAGAA